MRWGEGEKFSFLLFYQFNFLAYQRVKNIFVFKIKILGPCATCRKNFIRDFVNIMCLNYAHNIFKANCDLMYNKQIFVNIKVNR